MSREIPLSKGYVALVDDEDFERLNGVCWKVTGTAPHLYAVHMDRVEGKQVYRWMHREICGPAEGLSVDHINRNTLDNRRSNLRACTHRQNLMNRGYTKRHPDASQYKGVSLRKGAPSAYIVLHGKQISLGCFRTEVDAAVAYDRAANQHFGEYAKLNFDPARDWILPAGIPTTRSGYTRRGSAQ